MFRWLQHIFCAQQNFKKIFLKIQIVGQINENLTAFFFKFIIYKFVHVTDRLWLSD